MHPNGIIASWMCAKMPALVGETDRQTDRVRRQREIKTEDQ